MISRRYVIAAIVASTLAPRAASLDIGAQARDFESTTVDGRPFSFAKSEGEHAATVVLFVSTLCPYSNYYDDLVRNMSVSYSSRGVLFVGIDSNGAETLAEIKEHAQRHGHAFPILRDADQALADLFDARRTPEAFLLDREGRLRYRGRIASKLDSPDLKTAIDSLLAGREVRPSETKAFGCAIARR